MRPICLCRANKADVVARLLVDVAVSAADRKTIAVRQLDILLERNSTRCSVRYEQLITIICALFVLPFELFGFRYTTHALVVWLLF